MTPAFFTAKDFMHFGVHESAFQRCADAANRLLTERGVRVYGYSLGWSTSIRDDESPTHQALLINVQPIVKDTAEGLLREFESLLESMRLDTGWREEADALVIRSKRILEAK